MSEFVLTDENYYSREADKHYMSCSQFQRFEKCEAEAMAYLWGLWDVDEKSPALLQGQYFHSALESPEAFEKFCEEHFRDIYKTKTTKARGEEIVGKYAAYELLDKMLESVKADPVWSSVLGWEGENEKFMTGTIGGVEWRMKMDKYAVGRLIVDYKTSANIRELFYNPETREKESFIEHYGYLMRAAVYGEIERQNAGEDEFPSFLILAVSKQDPPDKDAFMLNDDTRWHIELDKVRDKVQRYHDIKLGLERPKRCGVCDYCRSSKKVKKIRSYLDLSPQYANNPDNEEYDDYNGRSLLEDTAEQKG